MDFYRTQLQEEFLNKLGKMLGVYWSLSDIEAIAGAEKNPSQKKPTEFFYPLACIIEPKFIDFLKKATGTKYGMKPPKWASQGEFEDMYSWDAEQFLKFVGGIVERKAPTGSKAF